jgi:prepilin-type N-terminal cleavage/methylation domain-containing protein
MKLAGRQGFSIVELLVAMSLMSVVMTAAFTVLFSGVKAQGYGMDLAHAQEKANVAMQKLTHDLRLAGHGCSPSDTVFQFAGREEVSFFRSGPKDTLPILVTYYIRRDPQDATLGILMRSVGDDSLGKETCSQIADFAFDYLDRNGKSLLEPFSNEPTVRHRPYDADINRNGRPDILDIRRISIKIKTRTKASRKGGYGTCDLESEVVPRNMQDIEDGEK